MQILNNNILSSSVITGTGSYSNYPLSNLTTYQLYQYAQVPSGTNSVTFALSSPQSVNAVAIGGHNLSTASLIISNDPTFTTNIETITLDCTQQNIWATFQTVTAQYFKLILNDAYLKQIGNVCIGLSAELPGMEPSQELTWMINDAADQSISFQSFGSIGYTQRSIKVNFPLVSKTDRDAILAVFQTNRNWLPFYAKLWDQSNDFPTLYAIMGQNSIQVKRSGSYIRPYAIDLTLKEAN